MEALNLRRQNNEKSLIIIVGTVLLLSLAGCRTKAGTTEFEYDAHGNLTKEKDGYFTKEYTYDSNGQLARMTNRTNDGTIKGFEQYDANGNMSMIRTETIQK